MARGFESKSVAAQQELADSPRPRTPEDDESAELRVRRRRLELSRADLEHRLETAQAKPHREMLSKALAAVDKELAALR